MAGASAGSASRSVRMRWSRSRRTGSTAQRRPTPLPIPQAAAQPSDRTSADPPPATGRSAVFGATCGQAMAEQQRALGGLDPSGKGSGVWPKRTPGSWRLARAAPQNDLLPKRDPRPTAAWRPATTVHPVDCPPACAPGAQQGATPNAMPLYTRCTGGGPRHRTGRPACMVRPVRVSVAGCRTRDGQGRRGRHTPGRSGRRRAAVRSGGAADRERGPTRGPGS